MTIRRLLFVLLVLAAVLGAVWVADQTGERETDSVDSEAIRIDEEHDTVAEPEPAAELGDETATEDDAEDRIESGNAPASKTIRVTGRIVGSKAEAIARQEVAAFLEARSNGGFSMFFFGGLGKPAATKKTNSDGRFEFRLAPGRSGAVRVEGKKLVLAEDVRFSASNTDVELGDLKVDPASTIAGTVRGVGGKVLKGAKLQLWRSGSFLRVDPVESDDSGRFRFEGLRKGKYRMSTRADRHLSSSRSIDVAVAEQKDDLVVELEAGFSVSGRVVDDRGHPVADATIRAQSRASVKGGKSKRGSTQAKSDESGFFSIASVEGGTLSVRAHKQGYLPVRKNKVSLGDGILLEMTRLGSVAGRLLGADGKPIAGSSVWATRNRSPGSPGGFHVVVGGAPPSVPGHAVKTDKDGAFKIENVTPGTVVVRATGGHRSVEQPNVLVRAGETTEGIVLRANPGASIVVTVRDPSGELVQGAQVSATSDQKPSKKRVRGGILLVSGSPRSTSGKLASAVTDEKGRATLRGLLAGALTVFAEHDDWIDSQPKGVIVAAQGEATVELSLRRGGFVEVTTVDSAGKPLGKQPFAVRADKKSKRSSPSTRIIGFHGPSRATKTDASGKLRVGPLEPGSYTAVLLRVQPEQGNFSWGFPMAGGRDKGIASSSRPVRVEAGQTARVTLERPRLSKLVGTVTDGNGPVKNAQVRLIRRGANGDKPEIVGNAKTDANGRFELIELDGGSYVTRVRPAGGIGHDQAIEIAAGGAEVQQHIALSSGTLRVRVVDADSGNPIAKATFRIKRKDASVGVSFGRSKSVQTKADGGAEALVPGGTYSLSARRTGYRTAKQEVRLNAGDRVERTLELEPTALVTVSVSNMAGQPQKRFEIEYRKDGTTKWRKRRGWSRATTTLTGLDAGVWFVRARKRVWPPPANGASDPWGKEIRFRVDKKGKQEVAVRTGS